MLQREPLADFKPPSVYYISGPQRAQVTTNRARVKKYKLPPEGDSDRRWHLDRWKDDQRYLGVKRLPAQHSVALVTYVHPPVTSHTSVRRPYAEGAPLRALQEALSSDPTELTSKELDALRQGLEALPPKAKLALLMVRQDGASYEQVARKLGVTTATAQRLVERAMEYLLEVVSEGKRSSG